MGGFFQGDLLDQPSTGGLGPNEWAPRFQKNFKAMASVDLKADGLYALTSDHDPTVTRSVSRSGTANSATVDILNGAGLRILNTSGGETVLTFSDIGSPTPDGLGNPGVISAANPDRWTEWSWQAILGSVGYNGGYDHSIPAYWESPSHPSGGQSTRMMLNKRSGPETIWIQQSIDGVNGEAWRGKTFTFPALIEMVKIGSGILFFLQDNQAEFLPPLTLATRWDETAWYGRPTGSTPPIRMDPGTYSERFQMRVIPNISVPGMTVEGIRIMTRQPQ